MPLLAATSHRCAALGNMHRSEFESAPRERAMRKKQTPQSVPGTAAVATRVYLARTRGHLPVDIDRKLVGSIGTCGNYFVSAMLHLNQSKRLRYYIRRWIALSQQLQSRRCYYVMWWPWARPQSTQGKCSGTGTITEPCRTRHLTQCLQLSRLHKIST